MFVHYFVRLWTNHYTLLTISPISFIFDSARNLMRNLLYHPLWKYRNARWEKWLAKRFTKCHLYTSRFSRFANIFSRSRQFDDKCIASLRPAIHFSYFAFCRYFVNVFAKHHKMRNTHYTLFAFQVNFVFYECREKINHRILWFGRLEMGKAKKRGTKREKSGVKYPVIHFSFFTFRAHFHIFRDKCIAGLSMKSNMNN